MAQQDPLQFLPPHRDWVVGKPASTINFVVDALHYLHHSHTLETDDPLRQRLTRFVARLTRGDHELHEKLSIREFVDGVTHMQYLELMQRIPGLSIHDPRLPEMFRKARDYRARSRRFLIVCSRDCELKDGLTFKPGQILDVFYVMPEAEARLERVSNEYPATRGAWTLVEKPPTHDRNTYEE